MNDNEIWVSVIVVLFNSERWMKRFYESIKSQTIYDHIEVIEIDNSIINRGFAAGCNLGALHANGKYLYLVNPDLWFEPDCIEKMYRTAENEQAIVVGSEVIEYNSNRVMSTGSIGFDLCGNLIQNKNHHDLFCIAGFSFIKRDDFFRLGALDSSMFMYSEEEDLAWRVWMSGGKCVLAEGARMHHDSSQTSSPEKRYLANRNHLTVIAKNAQHILLFMLIGHSILMCLEGILLFLRYRWRGLKRGCFDAFRDFTKSYRHIVQERSKIKTIRQRGDVLALKWLRCEFGRWNEVKKFIRL